ncbi:threonine/serine exporter ThrE family protein [Campylobacter sp. RKI_CA19_01128]|uniref:threonine/serine exporter family protein n=1 Tax=unclassified Campylobacter TaxID=2593542 RepID=UPI0021E93350|nr:MULTISPECIES: threonine/serine exporter ThrE family protein [unclassified Campylobacter]MCV3348541.1 threonine/serine exporter ThrE family protein [Campylobacter sp. RKI_CA19_01127]MCV3354597.1 threonine/serine exporter ThrE family protein [Campylobacter sp. RKI_CA19_01128]HEC1776157.1 threonine/serine exporter ThrE family protein [Campylobacter lari]
MQKPSIQNLTDFLIEYISVFLSAGTYTARVAKCVGRIANAYGYEINMNFFFHHTTLNIFDKDDNSIQRTYIIPNKHNHINFKFILELSALSWQIHDHKYNLEEAKFSLLKLKQSTRNPFLANLFLVSVANSAFCKLFGGDFYGCLFVFLATLVGFSLRVLLTRIKIDLRIQYIICSFLSSFIVFFGVDLKLVQEANVALGSSILYLIPGVYFINSVIDILKDHILMGLSRIISVAILVCCIAIGIYTTLGINDFGILR